jgi:hypothetical protein
MDSRAWGGWWPSVGLNGMHNVLRRNWDPIGFGSQRLSTKLGEIAAVAWPDGRRVAAPPISG